MSLPQSRRGRFSLNGVEVSPPHWRKKYNLVLEFLLLHSPRRYVPMGDIIEFIYQNGEPEYPEHTIRTMVMKLRRIGVPIESVHTFGYRIPPEARQKGYRCPPSS